MKEIKITQVLRSRKKFLLEYARATVFARGGADHEAQTLCLVLRQIEENKGEPAFLSMNELMVYSKEVGYTAQGFLNMLTRLCQKKILKRVNRSTYVLEEDIDFSLETNEITFKLKYKK